MQTRRQLAAPTSTTLRSALLDMTAFPPAHRLNLCSRIKSLRHVCNALCELVMPVPSTHMPYRAVTGYPEDDDGFIEMEPAFQDAVSWSSPVAGQDVGRCHPPLVWKASCLSFSKHGLQVGKGGLLMTIYSPAHLRLPNVESTRADRLRV